MGGLGFLKLLLFEFSVILVGCVFLLWLRVAVWVLFFVLSLRLKGECLLLCFWEFFKGG